MTSDSLSYVSACPRGLGAVGDGNTEDVSHGGHAGLQIELGGLGQVGLGERERVKDKSRKS